MTLELTIEGAVEIFADRLEGIQLALMDIVELAKQDSIRKELMRIMREARLEADEVRKRMERDEGA